MGWDDVKRVATGVATGGLSEGVRALSGGGGGAPAGASAHEQWITGIVNQSGPEELIKRYQRAMDDPSLFGNPHATGGAGIYGYVDATNFNAYKSAKQMLGRDITANEFAQILPMFRGPDGDLQGRAYLAQIAEREKNSPENMAKRAPEKYGTVNSAMQELLKRGATKEEQDHFGRMLATGEITDYELQQFIRETPEFRTTEDANFRTGLNKELEGYDSNFFNKEKENVISRFASAGIQHSPALDFALTNLMGDISKERSKYLAGVSAQQYQGNRDNARQDYLGTMDRFMADRNYGRSRSDALMDETRGRSYQLQDYGRERDDLMKYLSQNSGSRNSMGGMFGSALQGAGAMAPTGNPWAMGAGAGAGLFSYLDR